MQRIVTYWGNLVTPGASSATPSAVRIARFAALVCLLLALSRLVPNTITYGDTSPIWSIAGVLRSSLVSFAALIVLVTPPLAVYEAGAERRGRIVASIAGFIMLTTALLMWLDSELYQAPVQNGLYWLLIFAAALNALLLVRHGYVRAGATILTAQFVLELLPASTGVTTMLTLTEPLTYALTVISAGLLIRWWAGLFAAVAIPLLILALQALGVVGSPPDLNRAAVTMLMLGIIGALVAFHARSLDRALVTADARARQLDAAFTDARRLNAELRHSGELLTVVLEGIKDGLALLDHDGRVLLANRAAAQLCRHLPGELSGRDWATILPLSAAYVAQTSGDGQPAGGRFRFEHHEGKALMLDAYCFAVDPHATPPYQVVVHLVDMTEQLQLESLAIQNERLATSGRLAAIIAHEVNSPLQAIQNFLYLASSDDPLERGSYLRLITDEIERIGGLIRRLHDLNLLADSGPRPVELNNLVERVLRLTSSILARHHVAVVMKLTPDLPALYARPDQLTQVLLNLCLNAADAMPHGGSLTVVTCRLTVAADEHGATTEVQQLEVIDTGSGIPLEHLPRIFEPFYTTKASGTGLGLAISRQIIEHHGGQLTARNGVHGGAVFTVVLPMTTPTS